MGDKQKTSVPNFKYTYLMLSILLFICAIRKSISYIYWSVSTSQNVQQKEWVGSGLCIQCKQGSTTSISDTAHADHWSSWNENDSIGSGLSSPNFEAFCTHASILYWVACKTA